MPLTFSQLTFSTRRGVVPLVLAASAGVAAAMVYCSLEGRRRRRRRRPGRAPLLDPRSKRSKLVLKYFDLPALGEPIKILLILGGFAWEDQKVGHDEWPKLKPSTKWGQVPVLSTDDGFAFSQTKAICRYLAKLVSIDGTHKLYPDAPEVAYEVDELMEAFEDVRSKLMPTLRVADVREKIRQRERLFADDGEISVLLTKINDVAGTDGFMIDSTLTLADVWCFFFLGLLRCGFLDGISASAVDRHANLNKVRRNVANLPPLKHWYEAIASPDNFYRGFLPPDGGDNNIVGEKNTNDDVPPPPNGKKKKHQKSAASPPSSSSFANGYHHPRQRHDTTSPQ